MEPTRELYEFLSGAYQHFNQALFDGRLAPCMLTLQRQKGCMGLFYPERWVTDNGVRCHELALNPSYFGAFRVVELFQTLVHEQCHMWQQEYGRPSRSGYHNKQWAGKMESVGLMPSSTGEPGGRRTGQHMSDYPLPGGAFVQAARSFVDRGGRLTWLDRFAVPDRARTGAVLDAALSPDGNADQADPVAGDDALLAPVTSLFADVGTPAAPVAQTHRNKVKYTCPGCGANAWGKPRLRLRCEDCDKRLRPATG